MDKKKGSLLENPPSASSGSEYTTEDSSGEDEEEEEQDRALPEKKKLNAESAQPSSSRAPKKAETEESESSSEESDSDSSSESVSGAPNAGEFRTPLKSVPTPSPAPKKSGVRPSRVANPNSFRPTRLSNPKAAEVAAEVKVETKSGAKVKASGVKVNKDKEKEPKTEAKDKEKEPKTEAKEKEKEPKTEAKDKEKEPKETLEEGKKQLFQRVWSENDELILLEGAFNFEEKTGLNVMKDALPFYEFIKKDLHADFSLSQVKDKVWRLRNRFLKGKQTYYKNHDRKVLALCKKLWSGELHDSPATTEAKAEANKLKENKKAAARTFAMAFDETIIPPSAKDRFSNVREYVLRVCSKKAKMAERLQQLQTEELTLFLKWNTLLADCTKIVLESYSEKGRDEEDEDEDRR